MWGFTLPLHFLLGNGALAIQADVWKPYPLDGYVNFVSLATQHILDPLNGVLYDPTSGV